MQTYEALRSDEILRGLQGLVLNTNLPLQGCGYDFQRGGGLHCQSEGTCQISQDTLAMHCTTGVKHECIK